MATGKGSKKSAKKSKVSRSSEPPSASESQATHLALIATADVIDRRRCVIRTIENQCRRTVGGLDAKLRDVCSPCDTGGMADLEAALRASCGAPENVRLDCSMTVMQVINAVGA
jgi:hypothetical protein